MAVVLLLLDVFSLKTDPLHDENKLKRFNFKSRDNNVADVSTKKKKDISQLGVPCDINQLMTGDWTYMRNS